MIIEDVEEEVARLVFLEPRNPEILISLAELVREGTTMTN